MSHTPIQSDRPAQRERDALALRCDSLEVPLWRLAPDGEILDTPSLPENARWLCSDPIRGLVVGAAERWREQADLEPLETAPGVWLLPLPETERRRLIAYRVAVLVEARARESAVFKDACAAARLDEESAAIPCAVGCAEDVLRQFRMLRVLQVDLEELARMRGEVSVFSRNLAESYEEVNLLYSLGRSMNQVEHPHKFISQACEQLHATLAYRWIAVRFIHDKSSARALAGRIFTAGDVEDDAEAFGRATSLLLEGASTGQASIVKPTEHGVLVRQCGPVIVQPFMLGEVVIGAVMAGDKHGPDNDVSSADLKMIEAAAGYLAVLLDNAFLYDDQQAMFVGTLEALTSSIDAKDPYTCGHSHRVAELAAALARAHGLPEEQVEQIRMAGIVHDVGKIGVPEAVLCKTGRLTPEEFEEIKQHPEIGYQILKDVPHFKELLPGVLSHHERYDGRGYPQGLAGAQIPLMARIIGLVDSFDAMSSNRTYRSAMPRARVFEELAEHAGKQFDPDLVRSFGEVDLTLYDELVELHQSEAIEGGLRIRRRRAAA